MPTRTEHIPCPVCGVPRPIVAPRKRDYTRPCRPCAATHRTPSNAPIVMVPCTRCNVPRPIRAEHPHTATDAAKRQCRPCTLATMTRPTYTPPEPDHIVVEFLIAGTKVRANPAERYAAVAYLTARRLTTKAIADRLHCTTRTVERHRAKLNAA